jgi:hypothetical protein
MPFSVPKKRCASSATSVTPSKPTTKRWNENYGHEYRAEIVQARWAVIRAMAYGGMNVRDTPEWEFNVERKDDTMGLPTGRGMVTRWPLDSPFAGKAPTSATT